MPRLRRGLGNRGLQNREATGEDGETVLDIRSVAASDSGVVAEFQVETDTLTTCPALTVVARDAAGQVVGKRPITTEGDYEVFALPTLDFYRCVGAGRIVVRGAKLGDSVTFEVWEPGLEGTKIASGPPFKLGRLADQPTPDTGPSIAEGAAGVASSLVTAGFALGGIYLLSTNLEL